MNESNIFKQGLGIKRMRTTCALCGKGINTNKPYVSYTDGTAYHNRCIDWMNRNPEKWS